MKAAAKATIAEVIYTLLAALVAAVGIAIARANIAGMPFSQITGIALVFAAIIFFGWACFAREEVYEWPTRRDDQRLVPLSYVAYFATPLVERWAHGGLGGAPNRC